jgi:hypothetical protein
MINEAGVLTVPIPISQPTNDLMIDNEKLEDSFSLSTPDHYEKWLAFHHDSLMQSFIKDLQGLPNFKVWLNKNKHMFLGWLDPKKRAKLIKL